MGDDDDLEAQASVARLVAQERQMLESLESLPVTEIHALTSPLAVESFGAANPAGWALRLLAWTWRQPGGPLRHETLFVRRVVATQAEIDRLKEALPPLGLSRMRVRLKESIRGAPILAALVELLDPPEDAELSAVAAAFAAEKRALEEEARARPSSTQVPADLDDPVLGRFQWDKAAAEWMGSVKWDRRSVTLVVRGGRDGGPGPALETARGLLEHRRAWAVRLRALLEGEVRALKNDAWLGDGERRVGARRFLDTVRLHKIVASGDGRVEFWLEDGDLFGGHAVRIAGGLHEAGLEFSLVG